MTVLKFFLNYINGGVDGPMWYAHCNSGAISQKNEMLGKVLSFLDLDTMIQITLGISNSKGSAPSPNIHNLSLCILILILTNLPWLKRTSSEVLIHFCATIQF